MTTKAKKATTKRTAKKRRHEYTSAEVASIAGAVKRVFGRYGGKRFALYDMTNGRITLHIDDLPTLSVSHVLSLAGSALTQKRNKAR
jgi:hypothetical protein